MSDEDNTIEFSVHSPDGRVVTTVVGPSMKARASREKSDVHVGAPPEKVAVRAGNAELDALLGTEADAINSVKLVPIAREIASKLDIQGTIRQVADSYVAVGGNLTNLSRIIQIEVDQRVAAYLDSIDLPGPDALIKPKIREQIVAFVSRKFNELTQPSEPPG